MWSHLADGIRATQSPPRGRKQPIKCWEEKGKVTRQAQGHEWAAAGLLAAPASALLPFTYPILSTSQAWPSALSAPAPSTLPSLVF